MVEKRGIRALIISILLFVLIFFSNGLFSQVILKAPDNIICGADRTDVYTKLLVNKQVGLVANPSSRIGDRHLLDSLLSMEISVKVIFCPEHGFRGQGEAGEEIIDQKDPITGINVVSIYGKKKKPDPEDLAGIDILVFDIQDVGARFYTYISTLHYIMEAAADQSIEVLILDRPNPNGFYIDGPIREEGFESFVGMHPVPVVHGMTIGEYGQKINEEGRLNNALKCKLQVLPCLNYDHLCTYKLPVKPSPNLPNQESIFLYPSLCFFEGTIVSIGRGTKIPFQVFGHPEISGEFNFRPASIPGASLHPKLEGKVCKGYDLREEGVSMVVKERKLIIEWVILAFQQLGSSSDFFTSYFDTLAGTSDLRDQITEGWSVDQIRAEWQPGIDNFKKIRAKYLMYPDFE